MKQEILNLSGGAAGQASTKVIGIYLNKVDSLFKPERFIINGKAWKSQSPRKTKEGLTLIQVILPDSIQIREEQVYLCYRSRGKKRKMKLGPFEKPETIQFPQAPRSN